MLKRIVKYKPPKTLEDFLKFNKYKGPIEDEEWRFIFINDVKSHYIISNYGRVFNTITKQILENCFVNTGKHNINSIIRRLKIDKVRHTFTVCDLLLNTYHPALKDTHINPISLDGSIFNLDVDNIKFVRNLYYNEEIKYQEKTIYVGKYKTNHIVDTDGKITSKKTGKVMFLHKPSANQLITISVHGCQEIKTRARWMAEAFIPNIYKLKYASLIDKTDLKPSLRNICWTNRVNYKTKTKKELKDGT